MQRGSRQRHQLDIDRVPQWLDAAPSIVALSCSCAIEAVAHLSRQVSRHKTEPKERDKKHNHIAGRERSGDMKTFTAAALSAVIAISLAPGLSSAQAVQALLDDQDVQASRENQDVQSPRENQYVQSPRENQDVQSPRENQDIQSPRENQDVQAPRENQNVQSPRENQDVQSPRS